MTKLYVISDAARAWLDLTVDELSLELANATLMPSQSRFESQDDCPAAPGRSLLPGARLSRQRLGGGA